MNKLIERAKNIKCLICDLDGVLTDGLLYIDNHFNEQKTFHIRDGVGLKLLVTAGIEVAVITGSTTGIGKSIAETYARNGAKVLVSGRDEGRGALMYRMQRIARTWSRNGVAP